MRGPLKTIIRNKTDKLITYTFSPMLYIKPNSEFVMDHDIFTEHPNHSVAETMLVDAKLGRIQIVYAIDAEFATPTAVRGLVALSQSSMRKLNEGTPSANTTPIVSPKIELPPPVPFGKTANDMVEEERAKLSKEERKEIEKNEGLAEKVDLNDSTKPADNVVEVSIGSDTVKDESPVLEKEATVVEEPTEEAVEEAPKKRTRKKKEVVSL